MTVTETVTETAPTKYEHEPYPESGTKHEQDLWKDRYLAWQDNLGRSDVSKCPVAWCDYGAEHAGWSHNWDGSRDSRTHTHDCGDDVQAVLSEDDANLGIAYVDFGDRMLNTPAEVDGFAAAIHRAASVAFSADEAFRAHREAVHEFDAAVAECIMRAGKPGNRADAALIRLRNAQDALEATRSIRAQRFNGRGEGIGPDVHIRVDCADVLINVIGKLRRAIDDEFGISIDLDEVEPHDHD